MSDQHTAIDVMQISKCYHIGMVHHDTLGSQVTAWLRSPRRWWQKTSPSSTLWALHDVSFTIQQGEVVGIIGHNGAGKSTLLKILSNITAPTSGEARIHGRLASLLEVGTGFHPEFTGRENIFLNGAILGMRRAEIQRKFDAIVAFAEMERFIDTPIKRYSSGMSVRLAFAIAAHLEPDIVIIDEVLAVGDINFQRKCFQHMGTVGQRGGTVLLVSHHLGMIRQLCARSILLDHGRVVADGPTEQVIAQYLHTATTAPNEYLADHPGNNTDSTGPASHPLTLQRAAIVDADDKALSHVSYDAPIHIVIAYCVHQPIQGCRIWLQLFNAHGIPVLESTDHDMDPTRVGPQPPGHYRCDFTIPAGWLYPDHYHLRLTIMRKPPRTVYVEQDVLSFTLLSVGAPWLAIHPDTARPDHAILRPALPWSITYREGA